MKKLIDWANYYYDLGFNVTHIVPEKNHPSKKIFKAPTNNRQLITFRRQQRDEMLSYDWDNATGIGMILERNNIRAIDIDHKSMLKYDSSKKLSDLSDIVDDLLNFLNLPSDYPWVIETPTKGFHVIVRADDLPYTLNKKHDFRYQEKKLKALLPNKKIKKLYPSFGHFEMRWRYHLTLPPSINEKGISYNFTGKVPSDLPQKIYTNSLLKFLKEYCFDVNNKTQGYNLFLNNYHKNHPYIDFNTVYFKNKTTCY